MRVQMEIKQTSKQWAESRGGVLIGTPLKPSHDAEQLYRVTPADSLAKANRILWAAIEGQPVTEAEIIWALRETGGL